MAIIRVSLGQGLRDLHRTFLSYVEHVVWFSVARLPGGETRWVPPVDIFEAPEVLVVVVTCPGADRESFEITLDGRFLRVCGFRGAPLPRVRVYQLEGEYGPFERIIKLPCSVNAQRAEAHFEDGLLKIFLPKIHH
jgi:HSP20 family protein